MRGQPDTLAAHAAVVAVRGGGGLCSGTLIRPRVVLTAAHCLQAGGAFRVVFGPDASDPLAVSIQVSQTLLHPQWNPDETLNDIGVVELSADAPAGAIPIPALPASQALTTNDQDAALVFVGYGLDENRNAYLKRSVTNNLSWLCSSNSPCKFDGNIQLLPRTFCVDQDPGMPCEGDSGGPALLVRGGKEVVAGLVSFGDSKCNAFACSTLVDFFEGFLTQAFAKTPLGETCKSSSECDSGFCADGVCCVVAACPACQRCGTGLRAGQCVAVTDGQACLDGDPCNGAEVCLSGSCVARAPLNCDDGNPCTQDGCQAPDGCFHVPMAEGAPCGSGCRTCQTGLCEKNGPCSLVGGCASAGACGPNRSDGLWLLGAIGWLGLARWVRRRFSIANQTD